MEAYKRTTKKAIKDWTTAISARRGQEWLVVYVLPPMDMKNRKFNFFGMLDRLKSDWNSGKRERCVAIPRTGRSPRRPSQPFRLRPHAGPLAALDRSPHLPFFLPRSSALARTPALPYSPPHFRVVQLRLPELENVGMSVLAGQSPTSAETVEQLLSRVKDNLLTSFGTLLAQYSDDVRRMDAQRITLGWNYGMFFALKVRGTSPRTRALSLLVACS